MTPYERAAVLQERMLLVRARVEACRVELERQERLLGGHARRNAAKGPPAWLHAAPYLALLLGGLAGFERPLKPAEPVAPLLAAEPEEDPGIRNALALVYDFPDPATGATMLEVAGLEERPGVSNWDARRLENSLYAVSFGPTASGRTYRFEVDLADASVRAMTADSIFAASSWSF